MARTNLSIIIVNWNSAEYVRKCLASIRSNDPSIEPEIIVVDNASYDHCGEMLQAEFPGVRFVQNDRNSGFAAANNLGYRYATKGVLLFLNPDTEVMDGSLTTILKYLHELPDAGVVGCRLLNSDLSLQTSCVQPFPTLLNQALDVDRLHQLFPKARLWGTEGLSSMQQQPVEVEAIPGACMMIKRSVFEKVGLFSEEYFMYTEDIDLCYRIRMRGYKNYFVGRAEIIHHGGGSSAEQAKSHFSEVLMKESIRRFFRKTGGPFGAAAYKSTIFVSSLIRLLALALLTPWIFFRSGLHKKRATHAMKKWFKILRWTIGLEGWTQEMGRSN